MGLGAAESNRAGDRGVSLTDPRTGQHAVGSGNPIDRYPRSTRAKAPATQDRRWSTHAPKRPGALRRVAHLGAIVQSRMPEQIAVTST